MTPITKQGRAALDMIAFSELGSAILAQSDNGYNVLVGSVPDHVRTFASYAKHPGILVQVAQRNGAIVRSTAAGRYQILQHIAIAYMTQLHLPDFSPASQDAIATQQLHECGALALFEKGDVTGAIAKACHIWASFPGNAYGQAGGHTVAALIQAFKAAGGSVTA